MVGSWKSILSSWGPAVFFRAELLVSVQEISERTPKKPEYLIALAYLGVRLDRFHLSFDGFRECFHLPGTIWPMQVLEPVAMKKTAGAKNRALRQAGAAPGMGEN